jgi:hypothetical protein
MVMHSHEDLWSPSRPLSASILSRCPRRAAWPDARQFQRRGCASSACLRPGDGSMSKLRLPEPMAVRRTDLRTKPAEVGFAE